MAFLWRSINAITLATRDMALSHSFYSKLGLVCSFGGPDAPFTTMTVSEDLADHHDVYVNLFLQRDFVPAPAGRANSWGRAIFYVSDVDAMYRLALQGGLEPAFEPKDAVWGERYFHIVDPMGHELSFAKQLLDHPRWRRPSGSKL